MDYTAFVDTLSAEQAPAGISPEAKALWIEKNGDWDKAHVIVQDLSYEIGSAVHAYLHRKEGDIGNARYWYGRAGRSEYVGSLDEEWDALAREVCG